MVDFNGFDKGVIGKKLPSDSTLNQMKKSELIELLHLAESNHRVLAETYKIAVDTSKCKSCPLTLNEKDRRKVRAEAIDKFVNALINSSNYERYDFDECLDDSDKANAFFKYVFAMAKQLKKGAEE